MTSKHLLGCVTAALASVSMALAATVTGPILDRQGQPVTDTLVEFKTLQTNGSTDGSSTFTSQRVQVLTDAAGDFSVIIEAGPYTVEIDDPNQTSFGAIVPPGAGTYPLNDLAGLMAIPVNRDGDTMTGSLRFSGGTNSIEVANMTTAQRDALVLTNGAAIYNLTLSKFQVFEDGAWANITGGGVGGGDALTADPLSQFAETTSAELRVVLSDESGTGEFLTTNGDGSGLTGLPSASPGGSDTHVQFNDGGAFFGEAAFIYNKVTDLLTVPSLIINGTVDFTTAWSDNPFRGVWSVTPRSVVPSAPVTNDIYLDDGSNTASAVPGLRRYNGSTWEDIGSLSGDGVPAASGTAAFEIISDDAGDYWQISTNYATESPGFGGLFINTGSPVDPSQFYDTNSGHAQAAYAGKTDYALFYIGRDEGGHLGFKAYLAFTNGVFAGRVWRDSVLSYAGNYGFRRVSGTNQFSIAADEQGADTGQKENHSIWDEFMTGMSRRFGLEVMDQYVATSSTSASNNITMNYEGAGWRVELGNKFRTLVHPAINLPRSTSTNAPLIEFRIGEYQFYDGDATFEGAIIGEGSQITSLNIDNLDDTAASAGQSPQSDGAGGVTWETPGAASQTPWGQNIAAAGFDLTGAGTVAGVTLDFSGDTFLDLFLSMDTVSTVDAIQFGSSTGNTWWMTNHVTGSGMAWEAGGGMTFYGGLAEFSDSIDLNGATDATLSRNGAGDVQVEGNRIYRVGGADISDADVEDALTISAAGTVNIDSFDDGAASAGQVPESDGVGGVTWETPGAGTGAFSDAAGLVVLNTPSKDVSVGVAQINGAKFSIDGDADQVQLAIKGNPTQTTNPIEYEQDGGTVVFRVEDSGDTAIGNTVPDTRLHVFGADVTDSTGQLIVQDNASGNGARSYITFMDSDDTHRGDIGDISAFNAYFYVQSDGVLALSSLVGLIDGLDNKIRNVSSLSIGQAAEAADEALVVAGAGTIGGALTLNGSVQLDIFATESGSAVGVAVSIDLADGAVQSVLLDENTTGTFTTSISSGQDTTVRLILTQDTPGGNTFGLAGGTFRKLSGDTLTVLTSLDTTAAASTSFDFNTVDGGSNWVVTEDDGSIGLSEMAPGTDGNLISYDTSGNPVAVATGSANQVLTSNGAGNPPTFQSVTGDVVGPASSTDDALAVFDGTSGKLLKNSTATVAQIVANTAKVSNANHTGDATGSTALTIVANAVTLAKMAGGTDGNLISYDTNGDPVAVATGTANQVLTSNGAGTAPTFQAAAAGSVITKPITIETPTESEDTTFFYTPVAMTVSEMVIVVRGTTPSVTVNIRHHTDRANAGNALITSPSATTSTTTGNVISSFNDATIPANSFVWIEMDAVSGTVDECFISIEYSDD